MPLYRYKALDTQTIKTFKKEEFYLSVEDLQKKLKSQNVLLLNVKKVSPPHFFIKPKLSVLCEFAHHMKELTQAGIPLLDALSDLSLSFYHSSFRSVLIELTKNIKEGLLLSEAVSLFPQYFDATCIQLLRLAEQKGDFSFAFKQLEEYWKFQKQLHDHIKKSLRYPLLLMSMFILLFLLITNFVVPQMIDYLKALGIKNLPLSTTYLLNIHHFFQQNFLKCFLLIFFILFICFTLYQLSERMKFLFSKYLLKIPYIGPLIQEMKVQYFLNHLSLLLCARLDIVPACEQAIKSVHHFYLEKELSLLSSHLQSGLDFLESCKKTGLFKPLTLRLIQVGQTSGNLADLLLKASQFQYNSLQEKIKETLKWLEPSLILLMGVMLLWIVFAVMVPLYDNLAYMAS